MRAKQIAARRQVNQTLAREDAKRRCVICKRNLAESPVIVEDFLVPGKCCSDECLKELLTRADRVSF